MRFVIILMKFLCMYVSKRMKWWTGIHRPQTKHSVQTDTGDELALCDLCPAMWHLRGTWPEYRSNTWPHTPEITCIKHTFTTDLVSVHVRV